MRQKFIIKKDGVKIGIIIDAHKLIMGTKRKYQKLLTALGYYLLKDNSKVPVKYHCKTSKHIVRIVVDMFNRETIIERIKTLPECIIYDRVKNLGRIMR